MPRWPPDAAQRLASAALELFAQQGYESTTVIDIARRAGVTKSTFFRHFPDKREVLFRADLVTPVLVDAIVAAPAPAPPLAALAAGLDALAATVFVPERRAAVAQRRAVIAAHPELQEREALKGLGQIGAMADALGRRGVAATPARVVAELGGLAFKIAYERWSEPSAHAEFGGLARQAIEEVRAAAASNVRRGGRPVAARPPRLTGG